MLYLHYGGPEIYSLAALCKVQIFSNETFLNFVFHNMINEFGIKKISKKL